MDKAGKQQDSVNANAKSSGGGSLELVDPASLIPKKPEPPVVDKPEGDEEAPADGDAEPPAEPPADAPEDDEAAEEPVVEKPPEKEVVSINFSTLPESYHNMTIALTTDTNFEHVTHAWFRVLNSEGTELGRCSIPISVRTTLRSFCFLDHNILCLLV